MVWHLSLSLMNSFNKTAASIFQRRLCFLVAFPFIILPPSLSTFRRNASGFSDTMQNIFGQTCASVPCFDAFDACNILFARYMYTMTACNQTMFSLLSLKYFSRAGHCRKVMLSFKTRFCKYSFQDGIK